MSLLRASHRKMMTKKIARLMDINVFISHVFDAFLALGLNGIETIGTILWLSRHIEKP